MDPQISFKRNDKFENDGTFEFNFEVQYPDKLQALLKTVKGVKFVHRVTRYEAYIVKGSLFRWSDVAPTIKRRILKYIT